jgi:hypothetical protein
MKVSEYAKMVMGTVSVKDAKTGLRAMLSNKRTLNLGHAIIGVNTEIGELTVATTPFLIGTKPYFDSDGKLKAEYAADITEELGDTLWYTILGAKMLRMKVPSSTKKIKPTMLPTELVLKLNEISTELLSLFKKTYYGVGLGEPSVVVDKTPEEIASAQARADARATAEGKTAAPVRTTKKVPSPGQEAIVARIAELWGELVPLLYQMSWAYLGCSAAEVMDANHAKLASGPKARYKDGVFSKEAALERADKA